MSRRPHHSPHHAAHPQAAPAAHTTDARSGLAGDPRAGVRALAHAGGHGRVSTYAALGAAVGAVPLPWLPDALERRVRGALAQDIAARHGLSLAPEARAVLADTSGPEASKSLVARGVRFALRRVVGRIGPLALLPPARSALDTFVLGHLFARYLDGARTERAARIDLNEAKIVRRAIDQAMLHALTADLRGAEIDEAPPPPEELRDGLTKIIDGILVTAASVPGWVVRRIEVAFDDVMPPARG